jgi:hypothetical protein
VTDQEHLAAILTAGMLARGDRIVSSSGGDMRREAETAAELYETVKVALQAAADRRTQKLDPGAMIA